MTDPFISLIIPVYNGSRTLPTCLENVLASVYTNFECIVVDDCSTDDTVSIAEAFDTKLIRLTRQKGAAHARNRGAEVAKGDILLFIDADVQIYPNSIARVADAFEQYPEVSAVFGSYDDQPGNLGFISQYKNLFHHYIHQTSQQDASTFWTGFGAVKTVAFREVGGFDQNKYLKSSIEDIEMGSRLLKAGHRILLDKSIQVKHLKHFSFRNLLKSDLLDRAIPWTVLMLKNRKLTTDLNLKPEHRLSAMILLLLLVSTALTAMSPWFILAGLGLSLAFFLINYDFYRFFLVKRGIVFTLKVVPFHFLYYLYSSLGFVIGYCKYLSHKYSHLLRHPIFKKSV